MGAGKGFMKGVRRMLRGKKKPKMTPKRKRYVEEQIKEIHEGMDFMEARLMEKVLTPEERIKRRKQYKKVFERLSPRVRRLERLGGDMPRLSPFEKLKGTRASERRKRRFKDDKL